VTAEGVGTRDQLVLLRAAGCVEQGYYLARPMPLAELVERLSEKEPSIVAA
jgi:EAL domain-containing protein (putative c-di-GMP-specific phosphodiesterase class I)